MKTTIQIVALAAVNLVAPAIATESAFDRLPKNPEKNWLLLNMDNIASAPNNYMTNGNLATEPGIAKQNATTGIENKLTDIKGNRLSKNSFNMAMSERQEPEQKEVKISREDKLRQDAYVKAIYDLVMPFMHLPASSKKNPNVEKGKIAFYVDDSGNMTHIAVYKSSGNDDLNAAAISAVTNAAPFPPPPRNTPHALIFSFATMNDETNPKADNKIASDETENNKEMNNETNKPAINIDKSSGVEPSKSDSLANKDSTKDSIYSEFVYKILRDNYSKKIIGKQIKDADGLKDGKLSFSISKDGKLSDYHIDQTTGLADIDSLAINALRESVPFPPPPESMNKSFVFNFTLPDTNKPTWVSKFTDIDKDCIIYANSNQKSDIDFSRRECVAFGGYRLFIEGANLHYGLTLEYHGKLVFSHTENDMHDMGSQRMEWIYEKTEEPNGSGKVWLRGIVYAIKISPENNEKDTIKKYALRLDGEKTCFLGEVKDSEVALIKIKNKAYPCSISGKK